MSLLARLAARWNAETSWPPPNVRKHWQTIAAYRRRYENNRVALLKADLALSQDEHKVEVYTPVPWPRELCRFSAALLFSETPKVTLEAHQDAIDAMAEVNDFGAFAVEGATHAACEGRVGIRVLRDKAVSTRSPLLTWVHEDQVMWDVRHGRFYMGGIVVVERTEENPRVDPSSRTTWRLLEDHSPGVVTRALFKGSQLELGRRVPLDAFHEWANLAEEERTGLSTPTLIPWQNVPGAESDLFGLGPLFKEVNEAESLLVDRMRKSIPRLFVDRSLSDETGLALIDGVIPVGGSRMRPTLGAGPMELIKLVQDHVYSKEHVEWIDHLTQLLVSVAGYAPETWGIQGRTANVTRAVSGYALKLSQLRTLLTRSAKEHMALQALGHAVATVVAWEIGEADVSTLLPTIELGDGLPPDPLDGAQEVLYLRQAVAASTETLVKTIHPTWSDEQVEGEAARIVAEGTFAGGNQGLGPSPLPASMAEAAAQAAAIRERERRSGAGFDPAPGVGSDD